MTFAGGTARTPLDGPPEDLAAAVARVDADTVARFGKATADLLVRERASAAQYFQPVEFTREEVPAGDGRVRLLLRTTAAVDPAALTRAGWWDTFVRVKLGGWTKECRLGPAPRANRPAPYAAVAAGHVVLPYWTSPHAHLALDVDRATHRVGLGVLTPDDVTVSGDRLRAPLPLHVPGAGADVSLRLTSSGIAQDVPATLSPHGPGALLEAVLPLGELRGATWRATLGTPGPRYHTLPFALRAGAGGVRVVRTRRPSALRRLVRRARRRLGTALGRTAARVRARRR